ncbi:MAG: DNA-methyltransferase [Lachnospirales bacterium]
MIEYNKIYNCSCDDFFDKMIYENIKVDLILTDPPYNLNKDFGNDSDKLEIDDFIKINYDRITKCKYLLKKDGSIIWFGIHHYICFIQTIMYEIGLSYRRLNIWHYENGFSRSKKSPTTQYEPFLWFSNSSKKWTYNADDVRVPYKSKDRLKNPVYYNNSKGEKVEWKANPLGALRGDIWSFPTLSGKLYEKERTTHPTQKPEALITELIKAFCPKNSEGKYSGIILDPFHGSGTLGVCCQKLNKQGPDIKWIGIELEQNWCEIAERRLNNL